MDDTARRRDPGPPTCSSTRCIAIWAARKARAHKGSPMTLKMMWLAVAAAFTAAIPTHAHHSFSATYVEDKVQKVEGNLVQFLYRNPHSFVHLEGPDENGVPQRWAVEWGAGLQLNQQGVMRDTLRVGDHVIIEGNPGRNPQDHRLRMRSIVRPSDGWKWSGTFQ